MRFLHNPPAQVAGTKNLFLRRKGFYGAWCLQHPMTRLNDLGSAFQPRVPYNASF